MTNEVSLLRNELQIEGIDCAECTTRVEERLAKLAGVSQVKVLLAAEKCIITYDPRQTSLDRPLRLTGQTIY